MIVTKEHQEALVEKYVKEKHNQDECIGFIDGLNTALELVKNLTIPRVSNCGGGIPYDSLSDSFKKSIDSIEDNLNK